MKNPTEEIPVEGSLELLAMGYSGWLAWQKKRNEYEKIHGEKYRSFTLKPKNIPSEKTVEPGHEKKP